MKIPLLIYKEKPLPHHWARYLNIQTNVKNDNNLIMVGGATGSGKTLSAVSICEIKSQLSGIPFGIGNIVFSFPELMDLLKSNPPRGSDIIFDEPQASISSRDFQSLANKCFNLLLSTFRHRNYGLWFCLPSESMLDKNTRLLLKYRFLTDSINRNKKTCRIIPYKLTWNPVTGKDYKYFLRIAFNLNNRKQYRKVSYWDVPLPSKELIDVYEIKKREFTDRLNDNINRKLDEYNEAGKSMTHDYSKSKEMENERKPLTETQENTMRVLANSKGYKEASKTLGKSYSTIHEIKSFALKKGYTLDEFKENNEEKPEN